jgi:hypothetical protein
MRQVGKRLKVVFKLVSFFEVVAQLARRAKSSFVEI